MPDAHDPTLHGRRNTRPLPRPEPTLPGTRPARLQPPTTTRQGEHPAPGGFARFRLGDELGRGGIGVVRLAEDTDLNRELAIKLLQRADDAADVSRFIEEAQITAQLEHPNIVPVHELGRDAQGRPWLAMKRIAGQSLADMIRAEAAGGGASRPLRAEDTNRIIALFNKVADALAFAHSRGVVHRDIKPHNVMVGEFGEVLLVDWGLARPLDAPDAGARPVRSSRRAAPRADDSALSMDGDVFGTPAYMAPEQADGRVSEVDERSDIFSLGGVLYHMLTLEPPYPGRSAAEVLGRALRHHLAPPRRRAPRRGIPRELEAIVLKAMAARPADRYQRVADMQADLAAWQSLRPTTAWRPGPIARAIRLVRRHPMTSVTAALLLMGTQIVAMLVLQLQQAERARALEQERAEQAEVIAERNTEGQTMIAIREFEQRYVQQEANNLSEREILDAIGEAQLRHYLAAYNDLATVRTLRGLTLSTAEYYYRGLLRNALRDEDGALADYLECVRLDPQLVAPMINIGSIMQTRGDHRSALEWADRVLKLAPRSYHAWFNRGVAHREQRDLAAAAEDFSRALRIRPDSVHALSQHAIVCNDLERPDEALRDLDRALQIDPAYLDGLVNRAMVRATNGNPDGALADVARALEIKPGEPTARTVRGIVLVEQHRFADALAAFDEVLAEDPSLQPARFNRAQALTGLKRYDEALAELANLEARHAHEATVRIGRASVLRRMGRWADAIAECDRVLQLNPTQTNALDQRAECRRLTGDLEGAERDWTTALQNRPDLAFMYQRRGRLRLQRGNTAGALADWNTVLELQPESADAHAGLAGVYQTIGELDRALAECDAALAIDATCGNAWFARGATLADGGRIDDALAAYTKAIEVSPTDDRAFVNRGNIYYTRKQYDLALADFSAAIRVDPAQAEAFNSRAAIRLDQGDAAAALPDFDAAVRLRPWHTPFRYNRAVCKRTLNDIAGAIADLDDALGRRPDYWEAWYLRGRLNEATDRDAAIHDLREAYRHAKDATWRERIASRLARLGSAPD